MVTVKIRVETVQMHSISEDTKGKNTLVRRWGRGEGWRNKVTCYMYTVPVLCP